MEAADFEKHMGGIYANGLLMVSISLGRDLGFFDLLCDAKEPMSVQEISEKLGLKERYVYEWLSCMVTAKLIHQDRETRLYSVPEAHKAALSVGTAFTPVIECLGKRVEPLRKCFLKDGPWGLSFQNSPEVFEFLNSYRRATCEKTVTSEIIPLWFKQPGLKEKLEAGMKILDIGCGPGNLTNVMAQKFPKCQFIGADYSSRAIEMAKEIQKDKCVTNVEFVEADAHKLPDKWKGTFDMVFLCDTLHDIPDPHKCLEECYKVLKEDGALSVVEVGFHSDPLDNVGAGGAAMFHTMGMFFCLTSSLADPPHIGYGAMWGIEEIQKAVESRGFKFKGPIVHLGPKALFHCTK